MSQPMYQIKVTLAESEPPIWRRFLIPAQASFHALHRVLQVVMGWENEHPYAFSLDGHKLDDKKARKVALAERFVQLPFTFTYVYDFGDEWVHELVVEEAEAGENGYPVCLAGEWACPPEDCGGLPGFEALLEAMEDPDSPENEDYIETYGFYDAEEFDSEDINYYLKRLRLACQPDGDQPPRAGEYPPPVDRLLKDAYPEMLEEDEWDNYRSWGLNESHVPDLMRMVADERLLWAEDEKLAAAPLHAWRALGQLQAEGAVPVLLASLERFDGDFFVLRELARSLGLIGPPALPELEQVLADGEKPLGVRWAAQEGIAGMAGFHPDARPACLKALRQQLRKYRETPVELNQTLIESLAALGHLEDMPLYEEVFRQGGIDRDLYPDWEDFQIEIGLQEATPDWIAKNTVILDGPDLANDEDEFEALEAEETGNEEPGSPETVAWAPPPGKKNKRKNKRKMAKASRKKNRKK